MLISIIITELLIILKFDFAVVTKPLPKHIFLFWVGAIILLVLWTLWRFVLRNFIQILYRTRPENKATMTNATMSPSKQSPVAQGNGKSQSGSSKKNK